MNEISNSAIFCLLILLMIPICISYKKRLGLEKDILVASFRGFVQLIGLGSIIYFLFSITNLYWIITYVFLMAIVASYNAAKQSENKELFFIVLFGMIISVGVVMILWLSFSIIPLQARYIIPTSGMFCGASMIASTVVLKMHKNKKEKGVNTPEETIRVAMVPTIEHMRTAGLVTIPGLMTGMLLAGDVSGLNAAKYQVFVMVSMIVVASLSSYFVSYGCSNITHKKKT